MLLDHSIIEEAAARVIISPWGEHLITDMTGEVFDEEDPRAPLPPKTRLGADSVRALLLDPDERDELEQMPPQPVDHARALDHEVVAVIEQQPDLHRLLV